MTDEFEDKELGRIIVLRNVRAKNVIARKKEGYIQLTVPIYLPMPQIKDALDKLKPRLQIIRDKPSVVFSPESEFRTATFALKVESKNVKNYFAKLEDGVLFITCPSIVDFSERTVQLTIRNCIERVLRAEAKRVFPKMLHDMATKYNFTYTGLRINKSRSRWGSCSSKKAINLSYFCLLLPLYLIEFIMLHELCHTIEMNHSERFWKLLDNVTDNKSRALTLELRTKAAQW